MKFDTVQPLASFEGPDDPSAGVTANHARLIALIDDLRNSPAEKPWVEFKHNITDPEAIGRYISALSNAARLGDQHFAYVLWGVRDGDHAVVSTSFDPAAAKKKQQPLEFWMRNG